MRPEGLAEGAAKGPSNARNSAIATGFLGNRIATDGRLAVTSADRPESGRWGSTSVRGPGQNCPAMERARSPFLV